MSSKVTPSSTSERIVDQTTCRLRGSRPVVGSSSTSTCGVSIRPAARSTRRRSPPDRFLTSRLRNSSIVEPLDQALGHVGSTRVGSRPRSRAISTRFSRAVRCLSSAANWPVSEISRRTCAASWTTSWPATRARAGVGTRQRREHAHGRGLAGAVGPEQRHDGSGVDPQVEVRDRRELAEALGESFGFDCRYLCSWRQNSTVTEIILQLNFSAYAFPGRWSEHDERAARDEPFSDDRRSPGDSSPSSARSWPTLLRRVRATPGGVRSCGAVPTRGCASASAG